MQNQRHGAGLFLDLCQHVQAQAGPVFRIDAVDVADAGSQHVDAQLTDAGALVRVRDLAAAQHAVLFAADGAYLGLNRDAFGVCQRDDLLGLGDVFFDVILGTVEHNRGEALLNALFGRLIAAVVEVQRNRNGDAELLDHAVDHADDGGVAAHVLAGALGYAQDNRGVILLRGEQDRLGPLQVVDVEVSNRVLTGLCLVQHFFCRN